MEFKKALELKKKYFGKGIDGVKIDKNGFISITDLCSYFPNKKIKKWLSMESTLEIIVNFPLVTRRGKYKGGTFAHEIIAIDFCCWLSSEFKTQLYNEYILKKNKGRFDIKKILKGAGYELKQLF